MDVATNLLTSLVDFIYLNLMTEAMAKENDPESDYEDLSQRSRQRSSRQTFFDGSAPSVQLIGKEKFKIETFLPIIDTLTLHLKQRLSSYKDINDRFDLFFYLRNLTSEELTDTFPNVEIALRIFLSMMVTNCTGERSFSKLTSIKNELRSSMSQKRLTSLSLMSIEIGLKRRCF